MPSRFHLLRATARELLDRGHKASVRKHYPMPYDPDTLTQVILTNAGPVEVGFAWKDACIMHNAKDQEDKIPLELCREDNTLVAYE